MAALYAPPRYFDRGNGARLLQPQNQSVFLASATDTASLITMTNGIRASLIAAGIMKSS